MNGARGQRHTERKRSGTRGRLPSCGGALVLGERNPTYDGPPGSLHGLCVATSQMLMSTVSTYVYSWPQCN